ncbi:MAG TPA: electron transfer flavoprotein subunit alpha/FixB family protein [Lachnospiraceae bacterium]|nr:electron transfer flavoprotein subunit alpha/FixB family protein [Lachnospiraceae bacterium]
MKALVYIETKDGSPIGASLELLSAAKEIGAEADAVCVASKEGVPDEDVVCEAIAKKAAEGGYGLVLVSATTLGKIVAPRIATRIGGGSVNDAISIAEDGGKITVVRPVYGGTAQEKMEVTAPVAVISIRGGSYPAPEAAPEITEIAAADGAESLMAKIVEVIAEAGEAVNLEDAKVIVSGGRGMGSEEDFQLCAQLAEVLGGVVGATRPAIESGWINRTHQVGQSGKIVAPDLYIACGISGATQHISGMSASKYIIAINKDEDAPIFSVADIGIVADVKQVLPLMIDEFKKRKD